MDHFGRFVSFCLFHIGSYSILYPGNPIFKPEKLLFAYNFLCLPSKGLSLAHVPNFQAETSNIDQQTAKSLEEPEMGSVKFKFVVMNHDHDFMWR